MRGVSRVQSPAAETISIGRGAVRARDLHVARVEAQVRRVLAHVPALHVVRDHVDRGRDLDPIVDRGQQEGLRAPARGPGAGEAARVHVGEGLQEVQRADAVPQVQPEGPDPPQREARVEEAVVHLARVVVAHHVPGEDHVALPGEGDAPRRDRAVRAVLEAPVGPVTVRREDTREGARLSHRPVEVPGHVEARVALEVDLLDGVVAALDPPEDVGVERASCPASATGRHSPGSARAGSGPVRARRPRRQGA